MDSNHTRETLSEKKQYFIDSVAKFCDKCGTPYSLDDVNIIQDAGISSIIHFSCHNCKSKHVANFVAPLGISNRVAINTDLEVAEIQKFAKQKETSLEEILVLYSYLKKHPKVVV